QPRGRPAMVAPVSHAHGASAPCKRRTLVGDSSSGEPDQSVGQTPAPSGRDAGPHHRVLDLAARLLAAKLGLADELARRPLTPAPLAKRVGAHAPALRRLLRALASIGVFAETADGRFRLTPSAATLRSDAPASLRPFALMMVDAYNWNAWRE